VTWEDQAENWTAWARKPGHDAFPLYIETFLDEIVPPPRGRTLEIGCGEGRVVRKLVARGHDVAGVDASPTLVRHAAEMDAPSAYAAADAARLPFADQSFGIVVAFNALQAMHAFDDMARAVREAARVLRPGGGLCVCVVHPMTDIGVMKRRDGEMVFDGSYFERQRVDEAVNKDGMQMRFRGWTYTIEDYARAFEAAGLPIDRVREPLPEPVDPSATSGSDKWRRLPLLLFLRGIKFSE